VHGLSGESGQGVFALPGGANAPVALGALLVLLIIWSTKPATNSPSDPGCDAMDQSASRVVADLIQDRSDTGAAYARDALFRLSRARKNCRHGFVASAQSDYVALLNGRFMGAHRGR
jgi:hypothetical protein